MPFERKRSSLVLTAEERLHLAEMVGSRRVAHGQVIQVCPKPKEDQAAAG
jgi:hypothetical protein